MTGKIKFLPLPLGPCTDMGCPAGPSPVPVWKTRVSLPQMPIPTPRMRPNFRSCLRYNRAASAATLSLRKPVSSYGPVPVRPPSSSLFRHSSDTEYPQMRPNFRSCVRYDRAANETSLSYEKLNYSYECGRISYERAASPPIYPATKRPPNATTLP